MLANRLIEMIETHAEFQTREVLKDIATNPRTRHWGIVPSNELEQRVFRTIASRLLDPLHPERPKHVLWALACLGLSLGAVAVSVISGLAMLR